MDQFDQNREELRLKQIYAQATHQFGVAIKGCCEAIILAFGESFISTPTGCWCSFLPPPQLGKFCMLTCEEHISLGV